MRAVMSYFNPDGCQNSCGFNSFKDMLFSTALSLLLTNETVGKTSMVTSRQWADLFQQLKYPFDNYDVTFDDKYQGLSKYFWAFIKIYTYALQKEPFVHLDNDVYLWSGLPDRFYNADLFFQSEEPFEKPGYGWYSPLRDIYKKSPHKVKGLKHRYDKAYNCGVVGGNNLEVFKKHFEWSKDYIFAPENQKTFFEDFKQMIIHLNLLHEQYFLACLIKKMNLDDSVQVLAKDIKDINRVDFKYTHLWGLSKRDEVLLSKVRFHVKKRNRVLYYKIKNLNVDSLK